MMDENEILMEEAGTLLASNLTGEERELLMGIKHDLNSSIRWGKVVEAAFSAIVEGTEDIVFQGEEYVKNRGDSTIKTPMDSLFDNERNLLEQGDKAQICKHFVILLLVKKLLGALKTRTNRALKDIGTLTFEEEFDALCTLDGDPIQGPELDPDCNEEGKNMPRKDLDPEIVAQLAIGRGLDCGHHRTNIRKVKYQGPGGPHHYLETFCKDCRNVVKSVLLASQKVGKKQKARKSKACRHELAEWVPGQEGEVARCADKQDCTHLITAAVALRKIKWMSAGLEEFGDDPSQDEVTVL